MFKDYLRYTVKESPLFFDKLEDHLSGSSREKLDVLKDDFYDHCDDFREKGVVPENVYEYEN